MQRTMRILVANRPKLMREVVLATLADQPGIEVVGEVAEEEQIFPEVQRTLPDLLVVTLDETEQRPEICDRVLRECPGVRIIAVASKKNRSVCYWASFNIYSNDIEPSTSGILSAVREVADISGSPS